MPYHAHLFHCCHRFISPSQIDFFKKYSYVIYEASNYLLIKGFETFETKAVDTQLIQLLVGENKFSIHLISLI